jgi:hypothetical protein
MAKKTKDQLIDFIHEKLTKKWWACSWSDVLGIYLTRAELERIVKKVRKDLER